MSKWIKKGDKVVAIAGNEKGKIGTVQARNGDRVIVQGFNIRKKHVKRKSKVSAGIVEFEMPIHVSNLCVCNDEGRRLKLKVKMNDDGDKKLVYIQDGKEIIYRDTKKKA